MEIRNLMDKKELIKEVAALEHDEWAVDKEINRAERINRKVENILKLSSSKNFCKLVLVDEDKIIGFISIFEHDCDECMDLSPWYATMYVKPEYRGKGYSKLLNDAILKEAKKRNFGKIYLKTTLENYYEKFGAIFLKKLSNGEKIYFFEL